MRNNYMKNGLRLQVETGVNLCKNEIGSRSRKHCTNIVENLSAELISAEYS